MTIRFLTLLILGFAVSADSAHARGTRIRIMPPDADRLPLEPAVRASSGKGPSSANSGRDGPTDPVPGFLVRGVIENGETPCPAADGCPADTAAVPHTIAGHTASDVPLSASGPGAWQFTGVYENTDVFLEVLRAMSGAAIRDGHSEVRR